MKTNFIYITAGSKEEAKTIGRELVQSRLAACVNVIDGMSSLYWWKGEIAEATEVVLIAKTRESLVPKLIERVKALHSYEVPCVVSLPIADGNPDFIEWILKETEAD